jgi:hypothetical protein
MSDDYLWDRTGKPDVEVKRLEELLGRFRLSTAHQSSPRFQKPEHLRWWAIAAALVLGAVTATIIARIRPYSPATTWQLSLAGKKTTAVRLGQTIETTAASHATLESQFVGTVNIAPDSRLRVLSARGEEQRFALDRGTIHALIWAPPRRFAVDTPWAKAIDLGCQYTLHIDAGGAGVLTVETGWVAFQWQSLESFIPAGAACATRARSGPGTPYFLDAPAALTAGVERFDSTGDSKALESVLLAARGRDALTLWHLLRRTQGVQRTDVFDRFSKLVSLPPEANREAILRGDRSAIDAAWNALDLGDTSWWREWKRQWRE